MFSLVGQSLLIIYEEKFVYILNTLSIQTIIKCVFRKERKINIT